jgi:hypothetical protein
MISDDVAGELPITVYVFINEGLIRAPFKNSHWMNVDWSFNGLATWDFVWDTHSCEITLLHPIS